MKKQLIVLGMAGILGVSGLGVSDLNVNASTSGMGTWKQGTIIIGNGETVKFTQLATKSQNYVFGELNTKADNKNDKRVTTISGSAVGGAQITGISTGYCELHAKRKHCNEPGKTGLLYRGENSIYRPLYVKDAPTKISFSKKTISVKKGNTVYAPEIKWNKNEYSFKQTYSVISGKDKIKIKKGSKVSVKGLKKGTAKIQVKTFNGKKATLKVKVK